MKDIEIHVDTGDLVLKNCVQSINNREFNWVQNKAGLSRYIYGEIEIPGDISEQQIRNNGIYFSIPYTPIYKEFYIRIKRVFRNDSYEFMQNKVDGSHWFLVQAALNGSEKENIYASQVQLLNDGNLFAFIDKKYIFLYSSKQSDIQVTECSRQNANMMLKCFPTNNYRYPTNGVGLLRWSNSNIDYTGLSETLEREFSDDGAVIENASYNFETQHLKLDLTYTQNNG